LEEAYREQREIAFQLDADNGVEPEIEQITAAGEIVTGLIVDTDEDKESTPRAEPQNNFVAIANLVP
jgi:hypothetical protein